MRKLPRLHLISSADNAFGYTHYFLAQAAFQAGVKCIQYREKGYDPVVHQGELQAIIRKARTAKAKVIVNDKPDLAAEVAAHGVHLGITDPLPSVARQLLGKDKFIGGTAHNELEVQMMLHEGVDYLGIGPVFGTPSKQMAIPPLGLEGLGKLVRLAGETPVIAIGGIHPANLPSVLATGAYGVAVLGAFCNAPDPMLAARALNAVVEDMFELNL